MAEHEQETFLPEEVDEQIEAYLASSDRQKPTLNPPAQTVQALQHYFAPVEQDAALQRVWQRFAQQRATRRTSSQGYGGTLIQQERRYPMKQGAHSFRAARGSLLAHRLNYIAALVFVVLLVGSMLVVFRLASNGHSAASPSSPIVSSAPQGKMLFERDANTLYRLDMKTHQPLWHFHVGGVGLPFSEQVIGTTCYITGIINNQGRLYALDAASGKVRWQVDLSSRQPGSQSLPVVFGDTLYLSLIKNGFPEVEALAVSNGAKKWEHRLEGGGVNVIAASDQAVYSEIGTNSEHFILSLSARDGHALWQKKEEMANSNLINQAQAQAFVVDGVLCIGKSNKLGIIVGYNAASGDQLWSHSLDGRLASFGTTLLHKVIYVSTNRQPDHGNSIYAFSAKNGAQLWRYQDTALSGSSYPMVTEQGVYFYRYSNGRSGQTLVALNTNSGKERWTYDFHDDLTVEYPPAADNDQVYLSLPNNVIQILRSSDGKPLGSFKAPGIVDPNNRVQLQVVG
ncbi:MAG: PQQ-binding-like beta-propeller repeat protein [Ktedonobacteraceae bacterium]